MFVKWGDLLKKSQEKIIRQYSIISKIYTITKVTVFTILPLLFILYLVLNENNYLKNIVLYIMFAYFSIVLFVFFILRRCPNCYRGFSKYVFDPKFCPYCNVRLKR
jgi:hypothetical protein